MAQGISLRTKILGLVVASMSLLAVSVFFNFSLFADKYRHTVSEKFHAASEGLGEKIAAQLFERYGDVQAFAINSTIKSLKGDQIQGVLDQYIALYGLYDLVLVVDKDGQYIASNSKDFAGVPVKIEDLKAKNFKDEVWFKSTMQGTYTSDKKNNFDGTFIEDFVDDSLQKTAFGENRFGTSFTAQIKNEKGEVIGVITNRAGKRWFEAEVLMVSEALVSQGYKDVDVTVVNSAGKLISYRQSVGEGKREWVTDSKLVLNQDFVTDMGEAGKLYLENGNGEIVAKADDGDEDLVAFHKIANGKWIESLGWGVFVHDRADDAFADAQSAEMNFYFILFGTLTIGLIGGIWFSISINKSMKSVTDALEKNSVELNSAAQATAGVSTKLSESSTEQAAAIQETMAAVDEISAMVEKNAESAQRSKEVSQQSRETAEKGRDVMNQMLTAIDEIDQSNDQIANQMDESNKQLTEITKLISDIGNKTKVINEIVFQTKLLSFNASVEAARAGEYGKGFAVVAEEVGNLAQMSGNAAKEITTLLDESVQKVNNIVSDSKSKIERLISSSKDKVKSGADTARECTEALNEILTNVQSVDSMVSEIAVASNEQSTGIREISKAVGQMEQVTQQNSSMAQSSSTSAEQLNSQASNLSNIVKDLVHFVEGSSTKSNSGFTNVNSSSSSNSNVISFNRSGPQSKKEENEGAYIAPKKVVGSDYTPSSDDPGFSE